MTRTAIIGGHGKIALLLTRSLTDAGHQAVGVIRNPEHSDDVRAAGGVPVVLDIETASAEELTSALAAVASDGGAVDAVVFAAGAGGGSGAARKESVDHQGSVKSIAAARQSGIRRFVQISYIGADQADTSGDESFGAYQVAKKAADDALRASDLDWTIVRPGHLNDDALTGRVRIGDDVTSGSTSRANTAAVIAALLEGPAALGGVLNVIDGDTPIAEALASLD
ncbi:SDR family oxidoreductase [Leifsonia sp. YIM 134122]|uniref:SDR family oxidoreductase n=1 Tax=Leifsonia stereocauli TaxID=3134136 RepID=A0ABU9W6F6_9MICO